MRQKNKIWTTISQELYLKIIKQKEDKKFSTVTKVMLFILKNHHGLEEDYEYNSRDAKTLMITVDDKYYKEIEAIAIENQMSISKYVRNVLYSYYKDK